jgi:predicted regulator of Ras-like GTPase activity (Roadblock/LC7/MglB family)
MVNKEEKLKRILNDFETLRDVIGSAVVRRDGLMILSALPESVNSKAVAAMAAAIVGTGETASRELSIGNLNQVLVESGNGKLISLGAGDEAIFTALVKPKANMGLILMNMEKYSKNITQIIS